MIESVEDVCVASCSWRPADVAHAQKPIKSPTELEVVVHWHHEVREAFEHHQSFVVGPFSLLWIKVGPEHKRSDEFIVRHRRGQRFDQRVAAVRGDSLLFIGRDSDSRIRGVQFSVPGFSSAIILRRTWAILVAVGSAWSIFVFAKGTTLSGDCENCVPGWLSDKRAVSRRSSIRSICRDSLVSARRYVRDTVPIAFNCFFAASTVGLVTLRKL
ncbi:hypothetical protein D3C86_1535540 [compost metagenome]